MAVLFRVLLPLEVTFRMSACCVYVCVGTRVRVEARGWPCHFSSTIHSCDAWTLTGV